MENGTTERLATVVKPHRAPFAHKGGTGHDQTRPPRRGTQRKVVSILVASFLVASGFVSIAATDLNPLTPAAQAAPGQPGTPIAPGVIYQEDFQNGSGLTNLQNYQSDTGVSYTASPYWLNTAFCNGFILDYQQTWPGTSYCTSAGNFEDTKNKARALGLLENAQPANQNRALSTNTSDNGTAAPNQVMFATQGQLNLSGASGRYVTFSVDAAATACTFDTSNPNNQPRLRFYYRNAAGVESPVSATAINPCTDPRRQTTSSNGGPVAYGRFPADGSTILSTSSVGIVLRNESNGGPNGNDGAIDNIRILDVTPQLDKDFLQTSVPVGGVSTLQFTVTNTAELASKAGWQFTDNLPAGLKVASNPNLGGTCNATRTAAAGGTSISITNGSLAAGQASCTVTVDVTSATPRGAQASPVTYTNCAANISDVVGLDLPNCSSVRFYSEPSLTIAKTSSAGANSRVGDVVDYEVTVTNTGTGDFSTANRASMTDDLSGVFDDATYNGDAAVVFSGASTSAPPTVAGSTLSWSGPLAVGETATITYSVTLTNTGDGSVVNTACLAEGAQSPGAEPCASTTTELPKLTVAKSSDQTQVPANGGTVTYTVTVANEGPGDTTSSNPATFSDDLSDVLDDGTINAASITASTGQAVLDGTELDWSGVLAAGASATVTYTVTYDDASGNQRMVNVVCLPVDLAQDPGDPCRTVSVPGSGLSQSKSVDPASGTAVVPGQEVTYTLTFSNTGQAPAAVDTSDDASDVLDDATVIVVPAPGEGDLTAGPIGDDGRFAITGSVPVGATYTIAYTVRVLPWSEQGNHVMGNVLADPTGSCVPERCSTVNPIPHLSIAKDSTPTIVQVGDVVTYTVTLTNDGESDYTDRAPASLTDDLSDVLDDATYNGDVAASIGNARVEGADLSWTGALPVGESVSVTYSVTVTSAGNTILANTACTPVNGTDEGECDSTTTNLPNVVPSKTSDPASGTAVQAGQVITYTLSWTNAGTAAGEVDSIDNLSQVIDDAQVTGAPASSSPEVQIAFDGTTIKTTGLVAAGQTVTVTYQVTVRPDGSRGDNQLSNQLVPDNPAIPPTPPVEHPVGELGVTKTVDPASGSTVQPSRVLTYTLTFTNTGKAPVSVARDDVLAGVLDDADLTRAPAASDPALTVSDVSDGRFAITGELAVAQTATVTYQVTVRPDGQRGDDQLGNFVTDPGQTPPTVCDPAGDIPCTVNPVSNVVVIKTSDPRSGTDVRPGQQVTYTLSFTNVSRNTAAADADVDFTDHMAGVLDDASLTAGPATSSQNVAANITGDEIRITGTLASASTVTVTYTVTVKAYDQQGDHRLGNVVSVTGMPPMCATGGLLCTTHHVPKPPTLAVTGGQIIGWAAPAGIVMLLIGAAAIYTTRKRRDTAA